MKFSFVFFALLMTFSFSQLSHAKITKQGDSYDLQNCGHKAGIDFVVTIREKSSVRKSGTVDKNGCVNESFSSRELHPGENLIIEIKSQSPISETVPGGNGTTHSSGSTYVTEPSPVNPKPTNTNPVTPAPLPLPLADLNKVRITAENQARMIANRVVEKYGSAESARYNLWAGLNEGVRAFAMSSLIVGDSRYRSGQSQGQLEGTREARSQGEAEGVREAMSAAWSDTLSRFKSVVDTNSQPDLSLRIPQPSSGAPSPNISEPKSIDERIREQSEEFYRRLSSYDYLNRDSFNEIYAWKDYRFDLVKGWYREDWAWDVWNSRKLGGGYENEIAYFEKISDQNQFSNSDSAKQVFRSQFKTTYNLVIDEKWEREVSKRNPPYFESGVILGQKIGADYAQEKGYADGYRGVYGSSYVEGKFRSFPSSYSKTFQESVQKYKTSPVITDVSVSALDKVKSTAFFFPLQSFDLILNRVVNAGARGDVEVTVSSGALPSSQVKTIKLDGSASNKEKIFVAEVGVIPADASPFTPTTINISVGGKIAPVIIQVYFDNVMLAFAGTGEKRFADYAYRWIEFEAKKASGASYYRGGSSLLEKLVSAYEKADTDGRRRIASYREFLRPALGEKPGFFTIGKKDPWNDAQALLNRLQ